MSADPASTRPWRLPVETGGAWISITSIKGRVTSITLIKSREVTRAVPIVHVFNGGPSSAVGRGGRKIVG